MTTDACELAVAVGQALVAATLAPGEALANPSEHAIVQTVLRLKKERDEARHRLDTARSILIDACEALDGGATKPEDLPGAIEKLIENGMVQFNKAIAERDEARSRRDILAKVIDDLSKDLGVDADPESIAGVIQKLQRERDEARATNTRLNRRATRAEAAAKVTIEDCKRQGISFGRMLANNGCNAIIEERDEARAEVERLKAIVAAWREVAPVFSVGMSWCPECGVQPYDEDGYCTSCGAFTHGAAACEMEERIETAQALERKPS